MADLSARVGAGRYPLSQIQPPSSVLLATPSEALHLSTTLARNLSDAGTLTRSLTEMLHITTSLSRTLSGGGTGVLWELDEASTAVDGNGALLFGLDGRWGTQTSPPTFDDYTMTKLTAGGPAGQDAVRIAFDNGGFASQGYLGGQKTTSALSFNASRYIRFRFRMNNDPAEDTQTCKFMILGNGLPGNRIILTWGNHFGGDGAGTSGPFQFRLQIDGGGDQILGRRFGRTEWQHVQFEYNPGTASGAGNGYYKIWTGDTHVFASPTADSGAVLTFVTAELAELGSMSVGFFKNEAAAGDLVTDIADVTIATAFDSGWAP